ncbi:hypothetical protein KUTeg_013588 [Tegillarca granosa]|uniref:Carbohydrate kinase PfkB domain-containing protein n=1 Tax=Tegillarca granosa TaxID=220873 RepID=A0ABQ9EUH3_TEGGR|nr:hypothetical protein KUTeg_013588 [Tegillarca granosa]
MELQEAIRRSTVVAGISVQKPGTQTRQNSIIVVLGANLFLSEEDINAAESFISSSKIVVCQLEIKPETTLAALKLAKKHNDFQNTRKANAEILSGVPVTCIKDTEKAIEILLGKNCKTVIITMGKLGAVFATQGNRKPVHVPATPVTAVDTTGAGDAFIGALSYFLSTRPDMELKEAIRRSTVVAGISVQKPGTQTSFPWRKDLSDDLFK